MPKYLWQVSYTTEGSKGLLKEGGSSRRKVVEKLVQGVGGRLEAFYYALGDEDVYCITEFPDNVTAAAISLNVAAAGGARIRTVALLSTEEFDEAAKKTVQYRPPGA